MRAFRMSLAAGLIGMFGVGPAVAADLTAEAVAEAMGLGAEDRASCRRARSSRPRSRRPPRSSWPWRLR